jgi:signal transduction histidine kinase
LEILGDPRPLTPTTALTLYRVTQEALTNVRKHGGAGARATVRLRYAANTVALEVGDAGGSRSGNTGSPGGMGQLGMQERVSALGGSFDAGPREIGSSEDGYVVSVTVPIQP